MRPARPLIAAVLLVAVAGGLGGCGDGTSESATSLEVVDYQAEDLASGETVDLADLRGEVVLLSGWATWCVPCRTELPELDELHRQRRSDGLTVVAVNLDAAGPSTREVRPFVDELGLTMPTWVDADNRFGSTFDVVAMPTNVLVDREGVVVTTWPGAIDPDDEDVAAAIERALGSIPPAERDHRPVRMPTDEAVTAQASDLVRSG